MSKIASYMNGNEPDVFGRYISEIHNYNHFWLEHDHKFIQVLFPIDYGHKFNKHALLVEQDDIDAFHASSELRNVHLRSLDLMLDYYGLERRGEDIVVRDELIPKSHDWLKPKNHNQLRITRIIRSLYLLENRAVARNLQRVFIREAKRIGTVTNDTVAHWENATA